MSLKRSKLSLDSVRERIATLEASVVTREQKLEQLRTRMARSAIPDEKLLDAYERLERRLRIEKEQIQKLRRLLTQKNVEPSHESGEFAPSEEIDSLHRSFEEMRKDITAVKVRVESVDIRDLPARLNSFEERINRREEVSSDLYSQILSLQNALDEERQTVRKLSRRIREQDQNLDAIRDAVEESVVATVDLAQRLEELQESTDSSSGQEVSAETYRLAERLQQIEQKLAAAPTPEPAPEPNNDEELYKLLHTLSERVRQLEVKEATLVVSTAKVEPVLAESAFSASIATALETPTSDLDPPTTWQVALFSDLDPSAQTLVSWQKAIFFTGDSDFVFRI